MKKVLLASVLAIASIPGYAADPASETVCSGKYEQKADFDRCMRDWVDPQPAPPARVTVTPSYQGPPPIGWVYGPYTMCGDPPRCSTGVVNVPADGLNVRVAPNGPAVMSLVNGVPLIPLQKEGDWLLVAAAW